MVAKINSGSSLFGALSYNQQKVDLGIDDCIRLTTTWSA